MSITVLRPGLLSSIQDAGRHGYQKYGVLANGAMDAYALRIANILVGNRENEGVLEMTLLGPSLLIEKDTLLAITGGNLSPTINDTPVPLWRPVYIKKDSVLKFGTCKAGCRAYLAVAGGYAVPTVMGSKSTYLRAKIGGFAGRALQEKDMLAIAPLASDHPLKKYLLRQPSADCFHAPKWSVMRNYLPADSRNISIRVTRGNQFDLFTADSQKRLLEQPFQITTQSDRMGYRLSGAPLQLAEQQEMISEAVAFGTVQVPPDGNPIVLLADRQTAGGYPKIAQVALADLPVIAQARPGNTLRFREITLAEAEELYVQQEQQIRRIQTAIELKIKEASL